MYSSSNFACNPLTKLLTHLGRGSCPFGKGVVQNVIFGTSIVYSPGVEAIAFPDASGHEVFSIFLVNCDCGVPAFGSSLLFDCPSSGRISAFINIKLMKINRISNITAENLLFNIIIVKFFF